MGCDLWLCSDGSEAGLSVPHLNLSFPLESNQRLCWEIFSLLLFKKGIFLASRLSLPCLCQQEGGLHTLADWRGPLVIRGSKKSRILAALESNELYPPSTTNRAFCFSLPLNTKSFLIRLMGTGRFCSGWCFTDKDIRNHVLLISLMNH